MEYFWLFAFMMFIIVFDTIVILYLYVKLKEESYNKAVSHLNL
jgi:hypothetical protein